MLAGRAKQRKMRPGIEAQMTKGKGQGGKGKKGDGKGKKGEGKDRGGMTDGVTKHFPS